MAYQGGLRRWFKEKWVRTDTGEPCGSGDNVASSGKYCRPSRRVNEKTPVTKSELSKSELRTMDRDWETLTPEPQGSPVSVRTHFS